MMKKIGKLLAVATTVVMLGAFGVGSAMADTSTTSSTTNPDPAQFAKQDQEINSAFLSSLASTLGVSQDTLNTDLETAYQATINQEVTDGTITQTQATQILANADKNGASFFRIDLGRGPGGPGSVSDSVYGRGPGFGGPMLLKPLADALGMDAKDVISNLQSGQTLSDLATAKGTTVDQLGSTVLSSIKSQMDKAVSDGKMTSDQETQTYSKIEQSISSGDWITQLQNLGQLPGHMVRSTTSSSATSSSSN